jgi:hypothetical protein
MRLRGVNSAGICSLIPCQTGMSSIGSWPVDGYEYILYVYMTNYEN